jgi:hypothetical protein
LRFDGGWSLPKITALTGSDEGQINGRVQMRVGLLTFLSFSTAGYWFSAKMEENDEHLNKKYGMRCEGIAGCPLP